MYVYMYEKQLQKDVRSAWVYFDVNPCLCTHQRIEVQANNTNDWA